MDYLVFACIGMLAGCTGGLFGVGGGVITVPLLILVFELKTFPGEHLTHMALATSLAAMIVTSITSARAHYTRGAIRMDVLRWLAVGVVIGSFAGVASAINLTGTFLQVAFAAFLFYIGLQMLFGFSFGRDGALPGSPVITATGGGIGFISMLFGIGGGSMTVPFLTWCGFKPQVAVGTSAGLGVPIALLGAALYMLNGLSIDGLPENTLGFVYLPAFLGMAVTIVPAANFGAKLAHDLSERMLKRCFGCFLLLVSASLIIKNLG